MPRLAYGAVTVAMINARAPSLQIAEPAFKRVHKILVLAAVGKISDIH